MKPKTTTALFWTLTILFSLLMLADGVAGFSQNAEGQAAMRQLGYPNYLMSIVGMGKLLGGLTLLQTRLRTLREWAFAGFTINFLGASASWAFVGNWAFASLPLVMLAVLLLLYALWKKYERVKQTAATAREATGFDAAGLALR